MVDKSLPEYIHETLNRISKENGFSDFSVEVKQGSEAGDGFTSQISSITVAERNSDKKLQLVCKIAPDSEYLFEDIFPEGVFSREVAFYNNLMPKFVKFQEEKNLSKDNQFFTYPKCYAAVVNVEKQRDYLILEDLRAEGFKLWNKSKPSPVENVQLAMREIGKFHALSIAMKDQRPEDFVEFQKVVDVTRLFQTKECVQGMFIGSYDRAIDLLKKEEHKQIYREIKKNYRKLFEDVLSEKNPFAVLTHGDLWNSNMLFRFNDDGTAEDVRLLDWQVIRYVSPAIDLVYNLFTSTDKALRDREYDNLLQIYYDSLSKTVKSLGSNPEELFTFNNLKDELERFGSYALLMTPMLIQTSLADASEITDFEEMFENIAEGKNNQLEWITGLNDKSQIIYAIRLGEAVDDIIRLGYFNNI